MNFSSINFSRIVNANSEEATLSRERNILRRLMSPNQNKYDFILKKLCKLFFIISILSFYRINQNQEWDHRPVKKLLSTESAVTEDTEDEES